MEQELISIVGDPINLLSARKRQAPPHPFSQQLLSSTENDFQHKPYEPDLFELIESAVKGYYQVDLAGNVTGFDRNICDILGYNADELMGMENRAFMDTATAHKAFNTFNQVYRTGKSIEKQELKLIRKDGTTRLVKMSVTLMKNKCGIPRGFVGFVQDHTNHKQITCRLEEKEKALRDGESRCKEMQAALRFLMKDREDLQEELAESMLMQIKISVLPHIEWLLEKKLSSNARARILLMQSNLNNLMSPFARRMTSAYYN